MNAFIFYFLLIFALIAFLPVCYLIDAFLFKRDIRKYNSMTPEPYQIPYPETVRELLKEFSKFRKRLWLLRYQMYQYHEYITEEDSSDELH